MRWDDVRIFLKVAQTGSLSGAGRELGLNHSTVYRRLLQLEEQLGVRLFDRDQGSYTLTVAGQEGLQRALEAEQALLGFARAVEGRDEVPEGPVRLTAPEALLPVLSPLLASFHDAYPRIDLHVAFGDRFLDLSRNEADVALRPIPRPREGLVGRRLAAIAWTVYAPAQSLDAEALPWAAYGEELDSLDAVRWWKARYADDPVLLSVNSVPAMATVLRTAGCRGMLPCFTGDLDPALRRLSDPIEEAASALWLLVHPDLRRTARVRALLDHLWDGLRPHVPLLEGRRG
jgi:DNA-binding transcriptional LysR family regulator